jgi:PKD repeat protein
MKTQLVRHYLNLCLSAFALTFIAGMCGEKEPAPKPIALFDYYPSTNLVAPVTLTFTNKSKNATSYLWSYGSGQTDTNKDIVLTANSGGTYTVALEAKGEGGTDTYSRTIYIDNPPVSVKPTAGFTYSPSQNLVAPVTVSFTNTATNASSYKWDFGDGTTSTLTNPTKQFTKDGTYTVKLTATGAGGSNDVSKNLVVGKAASVDPYGKAVFWATGSWDYVDIETEGVTYHKQAGDAGYVSFPGGRIEKQFTSAPACDATGAYTTERPARSYSYKATAYKAGSIKVAEVSGNYTVTANGCTAVKLDFPVATGQVVFWTDKSSGWSSIDVTVNGTAVGSITGYATSAPACGTSKAVTVTGNPGTYSFSAKSNTGATWNGTITITANQCGTKKLEFTDAPTTACDWNSAVQCITVTKAEIRNMCGQKNGVNVEWKNTCTYNIKVVVCIQRLDGSWSCSNDGTFDKGMKPNQVLSDFVCEGTGKYKFYAMSITDYLKTNCPFPKE